MAKQPSVLLNEKLAPKLNIKRLEVILRLLVFVGKPLYFGLLIIVSASLYILNITGWLIARLYRLILKIRRRALRKSGTIFTSKRLKFALAQDAFKKYLQKYLHKGQNLSWKFQVFTIAFPKFFFKLLSHLFAKLIRVELGKKLSLFILKLKLAFIHLIIALPKPHFPKLSKLKLLTFAFTFLFFISAVSGALFWQFILKDLPSPQDLTERKIPVSTKIYDRNGILLYTIFKDQNRTPVKLDDIPKHVRLATLAIEDAEFYSHPGFSIKGIVRALIKIVKEKKLTGGSTITQQLVKNALLTSEKTLVRKLKEITLAIQVELAFSKDQILEMYLNEVSYGGTAYGIQEAAKMYFDKDVSELSLGQAALLAGLPKSPTAFSPLGQNPQTAFARQKEVLRLMQINGFISARQRREAEREEIKFANKQIEIKAPHFVFYVRETLEERYGGQLVDQGGLEVITSLDYAVQKLAEEVVKQEIDKLKDLNATNAAVVVLNPKTGEILAMVGSKDFFDTEIDGNVNVATRPRQPGSSIKVINYSYALANGFTPATIIPDTPVTFLIDGQPPYTPKNYEGGYRGNLTLRSALAESRNIPAVRVLHTYGVKNMLEQGQIMGITTWSDPSNYGLSLTLGGGEVKLIDLATVYATLANYGKRLQIKSVLKVTDFEGNFLDDFECKEHDGGVNLVNQLINPVQASESAITKKIDEDGDCSSEQVIDPRIAFIITDILRDNTARSPAFGNNSLLNIPAHPEVAVKTGTSNDLRDNLAIGYNQDYVVAVWVGNNDNSQMARIASGVTGATPIFNKIMTALLANKTNLTVQTSNDWQIPNGLIQLPICPLTGTLACEGCPVKLEWFLEENKPTLACNADWFKPEEPSTDGLDQQSDTDNQSQEQFEPDLNNQLFERLLEEQTKLRKKLPRGRN